MDSFFSIVESDVVKIHGPGQVTGESIEVIGEHYPAIDELIQVNV